MAMSAGVGITFSVQLGTQFGARVSRVLHPIISGKGRFTNFSVQPGDILVSVQGRDCSGATSGRCKREKLAARPTQDTGYHES
jgi:hypothetical protein